MLAAAALVPMRAPPTNRIVRSFLHFAIWLAFGALPCFANAPFSECLVGDKFDIRVTSPNAATGNTLTLTPSGLQTDNSPAERPLDGSAMRAQLVDIDGDGAPEVAVWFVRPDQIKSAGVVVFSTNRRKFLSDVAIEQPDKKDLAGYRGQDEFELAQGIFVRRFPVFRPDDPPSGPSGGIRQIQYRLEKSEAVWQLKISRVVDY